MPVDLTPHCKEILRDIVITSERICHSTSFYANAQNFRVSERLRSQLDKIRTSANTIFATVTEASFTDYTIDDELIHWLFSGAHSCLAKLKEMDTMLKPIDPARPVHAHARPLKSGEDKLATAVVFFDGHKDLFHSLITPDVWNRERILHQPSQLEGEPHTNTLIVPEATECRPQQGRSNNAVTAEFDTDHTSKARHLKDSHRQQLKEVLRWLAALNCTDKHNYIRQLRQEGTCKWFPNTDAYGLWRTRSAFFSTSKYTPTVRKPRPQNSQFLWLHGKAGCGKSVLVASTIEHLKTTLQSREEVVIFFYFDFQNERSRSPVEMMRSLLSQLCHHLLDLGVDAGNFPATMLEEKGRGTLSLDDLDKLCGLVSCAADRFVWEPIVVIDALDECADIESLLRALVRLHDDDKVRLLVTSRPHQEMMHHFTNFPSLSFEDVTMEVAADIELHVRQEINRSQLKAPGPEMKEIYEKLIKKAEGRFRWVQCQIDILKRCATAQELKKALDNLPTELEATYERILDMIDERSLEGKLARRVLALLMVALEPLRLVQILDMLLVDFPSQQDIIREGVELMDMLSSLVSHYKKTDVVSLSHFSVKEYLTGRTTLPMYQIILCDAHSEAVLSCMRYISAFIRRVPFRRSVTTLESWPMLSYVFSSGFNHLAHIDPESIGVLNALQLLGSDVRHHPSYWDSLCQLREDSQLLHPPWPSSRHDLVHYILIAYAPIELFRTFLSCRWPTKARVGTNPLVYAADLRKTSHATALLACVADVNAQSLAIDDSHHVSPLEVSIDRDEDLLVGELLQRGCPVTPELLATVVCMPWCSARVLVKLTQTDEFVEWSHTIGDEKLYRGIFSSARPNAGDVRKADEDHVALARRLRQIGQDISADSPFGAELVERALHAAHTSMLEYLLPANRPPNAHFLLAASTGDTSETVSIVRFLLARGADIYAVSTAGDTLLHLATICPWEPRRLELIQMFIDAGCNPYVANSEGETPLTIAASRGYVSAMEHLLLSDISPPSNTLPDALQRRFSPKLVQLLLRNGADVNATLNGESLLHLAITKYREPWCLELMRSFVEAGCNTIICSSQREKALRAAIKRRYIGVVELLLSHHILLPSDILQLVLRQRDSSLKLVQLLIHSGVGMQSTAFEDEAIFRLMLAKYSESECRELMKSFMDAGSETNSKGKVTTLYIAIKRKYTSVVELLLSHNVLLPHRVLPSTLQLCSPPLLVQLLVHNGADVHSTTPEGESIFHLAISKYNESECRELVQSFIEAGGETNTCDPKGETPLRTAIKRGYTSVVELLLPHNVALPCDIVLLALQQCSPLSLIRLLIRNGADAHSTTPEGESVFHLAISNYNEPECWELVNIFVEAGGETDTRGPEGETALYSAIKREHTSVVELLLPHSDPLPCDILLFALQQYSPLSLIRLLIRNGADVNSTTPETIFHLAVSNYNETRCWELVKIFVEAGGRADTRDPEGKTALYSAIKRGYTSVVELLLPHNDPLPCDILPFALQQCSSLSLIRLLMRNGADIHSTTPKGETVFHLAIASYNEPMCRRLVECFVEAGSNPIIHNSEGMSPLDSAIEHGYTVVFEYLLKGHNVRSTGGISKRAFQLLLAITKFKESTCLKLTRSFVEASGDICNSTSTTVVYMAIRRGYSSVAELLISHNVLLPHRILPFALQQCSPLSLIRMLIRYGADVHSTSLEGETVFHLAIANYSHPMCLKLVKIFLAAGGNANISNSTGGKFYSPASNVYLLRSLLLHMV